MMSKSNVSKPRYNPAAAAKSLQSCPTLCDPIDGSPPGSPVPGVLQARTLEWVAISFSDAWKWKVKVKSLSCVCLFATPWTTAHQAPLSMGFSRQEYWSGCHCLLPSSSSSTQRNENGLKRKGGPEALQNLPKPMWLKMAELWSQILVFDWSRNLYRTSGLQFPGSHLFHRELNCANWNECEAVHVLLWLLGNWSNKIIPGGQYSWS